MENDFRLFRDLYNAGDLSLRDLFNLVTCNELSKEDFHFITSYEYDGLKKSRGWQ